MSVDFYFLGFSFKYEQQITIRTTDTELMQKYWDGSISGNNEGQVYGAGLIQLYNLVYMTRLNSVAII